MRRTFLPFPILYIAALSSMAWAEPETDAPSQEEMGDGVVNFGLGLGFYSGYLPAAPSFDDKVKQSLYHFQLALGFPVWDFAANAKLIVGIQAAALYPTTVKLEDGRASSVLRFTPQVTTEARYKLGDSTDVTGQASLGWIWEKTQWGSAILNFSSLKLAGDSDFYFRGMRLGNFVPMFSLRGVYYGPFASYSSNDDKTPLVIDSGNIARVIAKFNSKGSASRWGFGAAVGSLVTMDENSEILVSMGVDYERSFYKDLREVEGAGASINSVQVSGFTYTLGISRPF